jgi:hypothetical protein
MKMHFVSFKFINIIFIKTFIIKLDEGYNFIFQFLTVYIDENLIELHNQNQSIT